MLKIGAFQYDQENKTVSGPAAYMQERGNGLVDAISRGEDESLNNTAHYSPSPVVAVLVRLQTDYAGWLGIKQLETAFSK